jgi:hypothetical protein
MVDVRDAILLTDRVDYNGASQSQLWTAFAKRAIFPNSGFRGMNVLVQN